MARVFRVVRVGADQRGDRRLPLNGGYMATNRMRPIHPGEILREEYLVPLNMSAHALAIELRAPASRINDIVRERRAITPDTALRLARCFGTTAQFWLNLQSSFDLKQAEVASGERIEREVRPLSASA